MPQDYNARISQALERINEYKKSELEMHKKDMYVMIGFLKNISECVEKIEEHLEDTNRSMIEIAGCLNKKKQTTDDWDIVQY